MVREVDQKSAIERDSDMDLKCVSERYGVKKGVLERILK